MKISYHGHSAVKIEAAEKIIWIDPFITGNPLAKINATDENPDVIIVTHGHSDHLGDTVDLAKRNNSLVIGNFELATYLGWQGLNTHGMSIGGSYQFDFGRVKLTPAIHGTGLATENNEIIYLGMPAGVLLEIEGKIIYHAGDTALFSDMKLIGERYPIDLAFLPIGDNFTMDPIDAAKAAQFLGAKKVVPIHYNTFPPIVQDPKEFIEMLEPGQGWLVNPGETIEL